MIAGVDLSTKAIDLVAIDEDHPHKCDHRRVPLSEDDGEWWHSARNMRKGLRLYKVPAWLETHGVFLIGVERPYGPSRQSLASLHTVLGALLATLPPALEAFEVTPAQMRQSLGLKGNVPKWVMRSEVQRLLTNADVNAAWQRDLVWPDDAYDAWAVAHAAQRINERGTPA